MYSRQITNQHPTSADHHPIAPSAWPTIDIYDRTTTQYFIDDKPSSSFESAHVKLIIEICLSSLESTA
jgi:hypothetical protein